MNGFRCMSFVLVVASAALHVQFLGAAEPEPIPVSEKAERDPFDRAIAEVSPSELGTVAGVSCDTVSRFNRSFPGANRYRGNIFRMDHPGVLESFGIELQFTSQLPVTLYFTILSRPVPQGGEIIAFLPYPSPAQSVIAVQAVGNNSRQFYSTNGAMAPMPLLAGREYAIGVAWGSISIANSLDTSVANQYPKPFPIEAIEPRGAVLGAFSVFLDPLIGEPPVMVPETGLELIPDRSTANHMTLCFSPEVGACCCIGAGGCTQQREDVCNANEGFFRGERVACSPEICECGACCLPCDGECRSDYERFACLEAGDGAVFVGRDTECSDPEVDCVLQTGACCSERGCSEVCHETCKALDGVFNGLGSTCYPVDVCKGACCEAGFCEDISAEACADAQGDPRDPGTTCATLTSAEECGGACCRAGAPCVDVDNRLRCELQFRGRFVGDATSCAATTCANFTFGACCISNGDCLVTTEDFCSAPWIGGVFQTQATCSPYPCDNLSTGACCFGDGSCFPSMTSPDCVVAGGFYRGDSTTCNPNLCAQPRGACCTNGVCQGNRTETQCTGGGGAYRGDGSICDPATPCPLPVGACCFADRFCTQETSSGCAAEGGNFRGLGVSCNDCPALTGACCLSGGSCVITSISGCRTQQGLYQGDLTVCQPGLCPTPVGACCLNDGSCVEINGPSCALALGTYRGDNSDCETANCPPPTGACCFASTGACSVLTLTECTGQGGTYQGNAVACAPSLCPQPTGACCFADDGSCEIRTQASCQTSGGNYSGNLTVCIPNTCPQPPRAVCCFDSSEGCQVMTEPACAEGNGLYLGPNYPNCTENPCSPPPQGACCLPNGSCEPRGRGDCNLANGTWQGLFSECSEGLCPLPTGACCFQDQRACTATTSAECIEMGGTYGGDLTDCAPDPCLRACCLPSGSCEVTNEADCTAQGGMRFPEALTCDLNCPISVGACCNETTCTVVTQEACQTGGGSYEGNGTVCSPNRCLEIVDSDPVNNAIDARQPHAPESAEVDVAGWDRIVVTLNGDATGVGPSDFAVEFTPDDVLNPPAIVDVIPNGADVELVLDGTIPSKHWAQFRYVHGDGSACLGYLPGDVNNDRVVDTEDVAALMDCLNMMVCAEHQSDIDRSGESLPADILRLIDLLDGSGAYEEWDGQTLGSSPCDPPPSGACCEAGACSEKPEAECAGGVYQGDGTACAPNLCIQITASVPESGTIDPRQPSGLGDETPLGIDTVILTFDGDTAALSTGHFAVTSTMGTIPSVLSVTPDGTLATLVLSSPIPPGAWTEIAHVPSGTGICLGYLPADVNGSGVSEPADIAAMRTCLQVSDICPAPTEYLDLDRSGEFTPFDLVRGVDLLQGAMQFDAWHGVSLPASPCP